MTQQEREQMADTNMPRKWDLVETMCWLIIMATISLVVWSLTGCSTLTDAASKIKLPKPAIVWTSDNGTVTPTATTTTTTTIKPADAPSGSADEASHGFTLGGAIVCEMKLNKITADNLYFSCTATSWTTAGSAIGDGVGGIWVYVKRNGAWKGWRFDHVRKGQHVGSSNSQKDFKNLHDGYVDFDGVRPETGETVAFVIKNYAQTERSNAIFAGWEE